MTDFTNTDIFAALADPTAFGEKRLTEKAKEVENYTVLHAEHFEEGALAVIGVHNLTMAKVADALEYAQSESPEDERLTDNEVYLIESVLDMTQQVFNRYVIQYRDAVLVAQGKTLADLEAEQTEKQAHAMADLLTALLSQGAETTSDDYGDDFFVYGEDEIRDRQFAAL